MRWQFKNIFERANLKIYFKNIFKGGLKKMKKKFFFKLKKF